MTPRRRWSGYAKARPRRVPGTMNGLERAYADVLTLKQAAGEIRQWGYEAITLKLAHDTRLTVDFMVITKDGTLELHETKGLMRDDALVKLKVAAAMFPFRILLVTRASKRDGGAWTVREISDGCADEQNAA